MGRRVKCRVTGEYGDSTVFYKVDKSYYKSKEVYEEDQKQKKAKKEALKIIAELLGYREGQHLSPFTFKKYNELKFYADQVILETLLKQRDTIEYYMARKEFENEQRQIQYIFAIIQNHIADIDRVYKKKEQQRLRDEKTIKFTDSMVESLNSDSQSLPQVTRNIEAFISERQATD